MKYQSLELYPSQQLDLVGEPKAAGPRSKALGEESRIHSPSTAEMEREENAVLTRVGSQFLLCEMKTLVHLTFRV